MDERPIDRATDGTNDAEPVAKVRGFVRPQRETACISEGQATKRPNLRAFPLGCFLVKLTSLGLETQAKKIQPSRLPPGLLIFKGKIIDLMVVSGSPRFIDFPVIYSVFLQF